MKTDGPLGQALSGVIILQIIFLLWLATTVSARLTNRSFNDRLLPTWQELQPIYKDTP